MIRPTRRGVAVALVAIAAIGAAWSFGPRSLNAVAVPAIVALAVGAVRVAVADAALDWPRLVDDHVGATTAATVRVTGHRGLLASVSVEGQRLTLAPDRLDVVVPATREVQIRLTERGIARLDGATIVLRDRLGLWRRTITVTSTESAIVYPRVIDLVPAGPLAPLIDPTAGTERQEFDRVRPYTPADRLSDIHWASSAKRPDELFVIEFADRRPDETVTIAAAGPARMADQIADATASIAVAALASGRRVGVTAGTRSVPPGQGRDHRLAILAALAQYEGGRTPDEVWSNAAVQVTDRDEATRVIVGDQAIDFEQLRADRVPAGDRPARPTAEGRA